VLLSRWNLERLRKGDPPFANLVRVRATAVLVRCPYCMETHRHPTTEITMVGAHMLGMHMAERCREPPDCAIGYIAMETDKLRLSVEEKREAERNMWVVLFPE
jgi:hypothetical protein